MPQPSEASSAVRVLALPTQPMRVQAPLPRLSPSPQEYEFESLFSDALLSLVQPAIESRWFVAWLSALFVGPVSPCVCDDEFSRTAPGANAPNVRSLLDAGPRYPTIRCCSPTHLSAADVAQFGLRNGGKSVENSRPVANATVG